ncbi:MAG: hypothetical protein R3321_03930 [Nitrososphaeraceae archaeon]|nr:hypothetical protein [Nitrososphaeraceae archaeon]
MKKILFLISITILLTSNSLSFTQVDAKPSIQIYTEKQIYSYGDYLSFTIEVSEITEAFAIFYIIDQEGKKSSAIPIQISQLITEVPSRSAFEPTIYPLGEYTLEIEYDGESSSTEFTLIDSGKVVIPAWIKDFSRYWIDGITSDEEFASGLEFLIKEKIIVIPDTKNSESIDRVVIPEWIKQSTSWWLDRKISDQEFASSIEYLIKVGIIQF